MEKLIANFLMEIARVTGVRASYLINNRGEILSQQNQTSRYSLSAQAASELVQALAVFELVGDEIGDVEIDFMDGKLIVCNNIRINMPTKLGTHEGILVVLGEKTFNKAHLRLSLNVSLAPIITEKKYKKLPPPVRIRKSSLLTRDHCTDKEMALVNRIREAAQG